MRLSTDGLDLVYEGKTKDVYRLSESEILLYTKDETTGWWKIDSAGNRYFEEDPGGNEVGPAVAGMGQKNLLASEYYFKKFIDANIPNHFLGCDAERNLMLVHHGVALGQGLECIIRFFAMGSLVRRFPDVYQEGQRLDDFFETTLKSDADNDPPISKEELAASNVVTNDQYEDIKRICQAAADVISADLKEEGLTLVDLKFELGVVNGEIVLIDEVSSGVMRVARGEVCATNILNEEELANVLVTRAKRAKLVEMLLCNKDSCCM